MALCRPACVLRLGIKFVSVRCAGFTPGTTVQRDWNPQQLAPQFAAGQSAQPRPQGRGLYRFQTPCPPRSDLHHNARNLRGAEVATCGHPRSRTCSHPHIPRARHAISTSLSLRNWDGLLRDTVLSTGCVLDFAVCHCCMLLHVPLSLSQSSVIGPGRTQQAESDMHGLTVAFVACLRAIPGCHN